MTPARPFAGRKRPINLTLNENLVTARRHSGNLSATVETLPADGVASKESGRQQRQQQADACVAAWNAVHDSVGSFADEHSIL